MNERLCEPFQWDDERRMDRGKVMTAAELEAGKEFGRYLDVDGDGIPYRTYPGTHPTRGSFFTRGSTRDRYAKYSEEGPVYQDNMERLLLKFETAKKLVPGPILRQAPKPTKFGAIYFGSTSPAMAEALEQLAEEGIELDTLRVRGFPFSKRSSISLPRMSASMSSSRTATGSSGCCWSMRAASILPSWCAFSIMTGRRSRPASSAARSPKISKARPSSRSGRPYK